MLPATPRYKARYMSPPGFRHESSLRHPARVCHMMQHADALDNVELPVEAVDIQDIATTNSTLPTP